MAQIYSDKESYSVILNNVHTAMKARMKRNTLKQNASELQKILQEIKITAYQMSDTNSVIAKEMLNQYEELINTANIMQKQYHSQRLQANTLFRREHSYSKLKSGADDIFEEDLAAIIAAGEFLGGNQSTNLGNFLVGGKSATTRAVSNYNSSNIVFDLQEEIDTDAENLLYKLAEKEQKRASTSIRAATGKIDITGQGVTLSYSKPLPFNTKRLLELMKDATFSAKNYTSRSGQDMNAKDWSNINLHLGNTNLYKAITGAVSEIGFGYKQQQSFFFRGMNTILHNSHGNESITREHFGHLKFIYELRGSGLLDEAGHTTVVKYLIYNDPNSLAIYVKDTASLALEALESANLGKSLLNSITLQASRVKS